MIGNHPDHDRRHRDYQYHQPYHQQHYKRTQVAREVQTSCSFSTRRAALDSRTSKRWLAFLKCSSTVWSWMETIPIRWSAASGCWRSRTQQSSSFSWILTANEPSYFRRSTCDTTAERQTHLMPSGTVHYSIISTRTTKLLSYSVPGNAVFYFCFWIIRWRTNPFDVSTRYSKKYPTDICTITLSAYQKSLKISWLFTVLFEKWKGDSRLWGCP